MDTPSFPAEPDYIATPFELCLTELQAGTFRSGQVDELSDLSRVQLRRLGAIWSSIPVDTRTKLLTAIVDAGEASVEVDFRRVLRLALHDPEAELRKIAISGLWEDDSRSCQEELLRLAVEDPSFDVRAIALANMTNFIETAVENEEDADLVEAFESLVVRLAEDDATPVVARTRAIEGLGVIAQSITTRALINVAWEHGDSALEVAALMAIARSHEARWLALVRPQLSSGDSDVRYAALRALAAIGTSDDVEAIARCVVDEDADVRVGAIFALGEIGGPGAVRILRNRHSTAPAEERDAIAAALDTALIGSELAL